MLHILLQLVVPGLLILAAATDLFTMTIPNRLSLVLVAAFFAAAFLVGMPLTEIGWHVLVGTAMLAVGFVFFTRGWIGGGDAKLFAAASLWLGWYDLPAYVMISTLLGGALTLAILAVRKWPLPVVLASQPWIARLHDSRSGIPYGIALAAGALVVYAESSWLRL